MAAAVALPAVVDMFSLLSMTVYLVMALLALSLAFVWGHGGILCFGQAAFFGLGAYAWAVGAFNFGPGLTSLALAVAVPAHSPPRSATSCSTAKSAMSIWA